MPKISCPFHNDINALKFKTFLYRGFRQHYFGAMGLFHTTHRRRQGRAIFYIPTGCPATHPVRAGLSPRKGTRTALMTNGISYSLSPCLIIHVGFALASFLFKKALHLLFACVHHFSTLEWIKIKADRGMNGWKKFSYKPCRIPRNIVLP